MPVTVKEETRLFIIETDHSEYQLMADKYGILRHLWYGDKVGMSMEYLCVYPDVGFSGNINEAGNCRTYSMTRSAFIWKKLYGSFKQAISQHKRHYAGAVDKFREGFPGHEANTYV